MELQSAHELLIGGMVQVFHGSNLTVEKPRLLPQQRNLDFGAGFYTTTNLDQAKDFARKVVLREGGGKPIVSVYDVDLQCVSDELITLRFDSPNEGWLDFISANRSGEYTGKAYDLVVGPVANDDVYVTVTLYLSGILSKSQALDALKVKELYDQYVWKTGAAVGLLVFSGTLNAEQGL